MPPKKQALRKEQRHFFYKDEQAAKVRRIRVQAENSDGQKEMIESQNVVHSRSLSWIQKQIKKQDHAPKLSKSSLLFPKKPLTSLTNRAKQLLTNSVRASHTTNEHKKSHSVSNKERKNDNKIYITRPHLAKGKKSSYQPREIFPGVFLYHSGKTTKLMNLSSKPKIKEVLVASHLLAKHPLRENRIFNSSRQSAVNHASSRSSLLSHTEKSNKLVVPDTPSSLPSSTKNSFNSSEMVLPTEPPHVTSYLRTTEITETQLHLAEPGPERDQEEEGDLSDYSYEEVEPRPGWAEEAINWQRTFSVNSMDFETLRSDWNDLRCNVSGNLQMPESEVVDVLAQYMEKLNERNGG